MYYVNYYSKRTRDPFRGRIARKTPRKPKTSKYPNIPWVDLVPPRKPSKPGPKSLHKALKASVKSPVHKYKHNGIQPYPEQLDAVERFLRMHPKLTNAGTKLLGKLEVPASMIARFYLQRVEHLNKIRKHII